MTYNYGFTPINNSQMKKLIFIYLFALIAVVTVSCKKSTTHVVMYTLSASSKAVITVNYTDQNGNIQTVNNTTGQWTTSFSSTDHGTVFKLIAASTDTSKVGGKIYIDNKQSAQTSTNATNISISATLP